MSAKEIGRRDILKSAVVGSAALFPILQPALGNAAQSHAHVVSPAAAASLSKLRFFAEAQSELTAAIADLILPPTDTPGAKEAGVHEHIDLVLSEEVPEVQQAFIEGLSWIDKKSQKLYGSKFLSLKPEQQTQILTLVSDSTKTKKEDAVGRAFFLDIRRRTVFAYYTSRIGIHEELTYKGNQTLDTWRGCPHPDHHGDQG